MNISLKIYNIKYNKMHFILFEIKRHYSHTFRWYCICKKVNSDANASCPYICNHNSSVT